MTGNYQDLKTALTDTGNPFVWITGEGWCFNEQAEGIKVSAEVALSVDSFDDLIAAMDAPASTEQIIEQPKKAKKK